MQNRIRAGHAPAVLLPGADQHNDQHDQDDKNDQFDHACHPSISNCTYHTPSDTKKFMRIAGMNFRWVPKL